MTAVAKLLPCPFCGEPGEFAGCEQDGHYVRCSGRGCYGEVGENYDGCAMPSHMFSSQEDAAAAWNRRASPAELGGVEEEARRLFELNSANWPVVVPWDELHPQTRELWHQFALKQLSTPRAAEAEWLPIESAPKDGTAILAFWAPRPDHPYFQTVDGGNYAVAEFREYEWRPSGDDEDTTCWANPTHWRPLPAPPSLTPPSAKGENGNG